MLLCRDKYVNFHLFLFVIVANLIFDPKLSYECNFAPIFGYEKQKINMQDTNFSVHFEVDPKKVYDMSD